MKLKERGWLWGHPEGRYNLTWREKHVENGEVNVVKSRMTPTEFCVYMGINRVFMIPLDVDVDRHQYNMSFRRMHDVAWECFDATADIEKLERYINEAKDFKNITGVVLDDFFERDGAFENISADQLWKIRERLKNNEVRPLDYWMVVYTNNIGTDQVPEDVAIRYMEPLDGVTLWCWKESDVHEIAEKWDQFVRMTPGKRRLLGVYLWNFGEGKQATAKSVRQQLDFCREKMLSGELEGFILHTNTMGDMELPAYVECEKWMDEHGDEELPDLD